MNRRDTLKGALALSSLAALPAVAQNLDRPVRFIVPFAPGGTSKATTGSDATFSIAFEPLPPPTPIITAVTGTPNAVVIDFSAPGASLADFALERSPDLATWLPDASAQFAGESPSFSVNAVGITPGSKEFFRVRRLR